MQPRTLAIVTSLVLAPLAIAANVIISPNMGMPVPVVGTDPGPDWANNINASLSIIDGHDHTPGYGVPVPPAGLNINSDLTFQSNNATNLRSTRYTAQSAPISGGSDLGAVYVSGVDLYYNDENGNQVRITQGGSVTGSAGTITGLPSGTASASYAASTFTFQSATNTPAIMAVGPLKIGTNTASPHTVTLASPNALASNYTVTLPSAAPASTSVMEMDTSGNTSTQAITGSGNIVASTSPTISSASISSSTVSGGSLAGSIGGTPTFTGNVSMNGGASFGAAASFGAGGSFLGTYGGSPTFSGSPIFSGNPDFSGTPTMGTVSISTAINGGPTINGGALSGTFNGSPTFSGAVTVSGTGGNVPHACIRRSHAGGSSNPNTVSCSGAEIVTGGGCTQASSIPILVTGPDTNSSWFCQWDSTPAAGVAYAICCTL